MKGRLIRRFGITFLIFIFFTGKIFSQEESSTEELLEISFEDLLNMEITSVSKKAERLQDVPSSLYVITSEDIKRSSAQNLMHLLREHVPGIWAVANDYKDADLFIRNVNEESTLFLLDGTPLLDITYFSIDMESFDIPVDIIERIEVIRGSGGSIYGANSASGIVNIITKKSRNQSKLLTSVEYVNPGRTAVNFVFSPVRNDKIAATLYTKYDYFTGFEQIDQIENESATVPVTHGTGTTIITNRFTENDNLFKTLTAGYKIQFDVSEKLKLSTGLHVVNFQNDRYFQVFKRDEGEFKVVDGEIKPFASDSIFFSNNDKVRITGNFQVDYSFKKSHNMFFRVSANHENREYVSGGGYHGNNGIVDFEIQDNIEFGINSLSFGGNYRFVNYNMDWEEIASIAFINPKTNENLKGFFIQDKIAFNDGKFNFYLGIKGENFSLINNKFYFSPMAKVSFIPTQNLTLWGGFTQSYTTPGFNLTNVELDIFRANSSAMYPIVYPLVEFQVYATAYQNAIDQGADDATASASATNYIESIEGMQVIDQQTNQQLENQYPGGNVNISAINGPNTEPTSFKNFELGIRFNQNDKISVETNIYYTLVENGVGNSPVSIGRIESITRPGEMIDPYYYGNYVKGYNMGIETMFKTQISEDWKLEISHNYFTYNEELKENNDFEIDDLPSEMLDLIDEDYPQLPKHTLKLKTYYNITKDLYLSVSTAYASAFFVKYSTAFPNFQEELQRFEPLFGEGGNTTLIGGKFDNRFIMNFKIEKTFMNDKLNVFVYGNDFLKRPFVEGENQLLQIYPRKVSGVFGGGVVLNIK